MATADIRHSSDGQQAIAIARVSIGEGVAFENLVRVSKDPAAQKQADCGGSCGSSCSDCSESCSGCSTVSTNAPTISEMVGALAWAGERAMSRGEVSGFWREATAYDSYISAITLLGKRAYTGLTTNIDGTRGVGGGPGPFLLPNPGDGDEKKANDKDPCPPGWRPVPGPFGKIRCVDCAPGVPVVVSSLGYICGGPPSPPDDPPPPPRKPDPFGPWWEDPPPPLPDPPKEPEKPKDDKVCCCAPSGPPKIEHLGDSTWLGSAESRFRVTITIQVDGSGTSSPCRLEWHEFTTEGYERITDKGVTKKDTEDKIRARKTLKKAEVSYEVPENKFSELGSQEDEMMKALDDNAKKNPKEPNPFAGFFLTDAKRKLGECKSQSIVLVDTPSSDNDRDLYIEICVYPSANPKCNASGPQCAKVHQSIRSSKADFKHGDNLKGPDEPWPVKWPPGDKK